MKKYIKVITVALLVAFSHAGQMQAAGCSACCGKTKHTHSPKAKRDKSSSDIVRVQGFGCSSCATAKQVRTKKDETVKGQAWGYPRKSSYRQVAIDDVDVDESVSPMTYQQARDYLYMQKSSDDDERTAVQSSTESSHQDAELNREFKEFLWQQDTDVNM